ncbi:MAG: hypothetical protein ACP5PV_01380 [Methanothrix sp.]
MSEPNEKLFLSHLTMVISEMAVAIEHGYLGKVSFAEIYQGIENGNLISFLKERLGDTVDLSLVMPDQDQGRLFIDAMRYVVPGLEGRERRKTGIEKCGLCLLIVLCVEAVRQTELWQHPRGK